MKVPHDYIRAILSNEIIINCVNQDKVKLLKKMGAKSKIFDAEIWRLNYENKDNSDLSKKLEELRDLDFCFAGAAGGWPPAAVFEYFREKGLVHGKIIEIMWSAPGKEIKRER